MKLSNYCDSNNNRIVCAKDFESPKINVEFLGKNNLLEIDDDANIYYLNVKFTQNNGHVRIGKCRTVGYIRCGEDSYIEIGDGFTSDGGACFLASEGTTLKVGKDCMFAQNVELRTDDAHPIYDVDTGNRSNYSADIEIGDHVWLANSVRVLKGAKIGSGSYVGVYSVVNRQFPNNCGIVGSPAKICAINKTWTRPSLFENLQEEQGKIYDELDSSYKKETILNMDMKSVRDYVARKKILVDNFSCELNTFHGTTICYDKIKQSLIHSRCTQKGTFPIEVKRKGILLSMFYRDGEDIYYFNGFDGLTSIFSKCESLFCFEKKNDNSISIVVNGRYLSARNDGSVSLVDVANEFECFEVKTDLFNECCDEQHKSVCFFAATSNKYAPVLATLILSLKSNSREVFNNSNFIIYHEGMSDKNISAMKRIGNNIIIKDINYDVCPDVIFTHKQVKNRWGKFVYIKLRGFELIKEYDKAVWIDADMVNVGNIYKILSYTNMAGRPILGIDKYLPTDNEDVKTIIPNGGLIVFSKEVRQHNIDQAKIVQAYHYVKDMKLSGVDEILMSGIAHFSKITFHSIPLEYNIPDALQNKKNQLNLKLVHFMNSKPWEDFYSLIQNPVWETYYNSFIKSGGEDMMGESPLFEQHYRGVYYWRVTTLLSMLGDIKAFQKGIILSSFKFKHGDLEFFLANDKNESFVVSINKQYYCSPAATHYISICSKKRVELNKIVQIGSIIEIVKEYSDDGMMKISFKNLKELPMIIDRLVELLLKNL